MIDVDQVNGDFNKCEFYTKSHSIRNPQYPQS